MEPNNCAPVVVRACGLVMIWHQFLVLQPSQQSRASNQLLIFECSYHHVFPSHKKETDAYQNLSLVLTATSPLAIISLGSLP